MEAAYIDRIDRAQECLWRARAEYSEADMPGLAGELMHHLDMVLRVVTSIRIISGELDDAPLAVTPHVRVGPANSPGFAAARPFDVNMKITPD
jgi:hypothetical protein